jgi:transposase-like protein
MERGVKLTVSEKEKIAKKYLNRTGTRQDFSLMHSIPVSTIDYWVKKYRKTNSKAKPKCSDFVPVIAENAKVISSKTISIDFPGGVRMSCSGEFGFSDISALASELSRITR